MKELLRWGKILGLFILTVLVLSILYLRITRFSDQMIYQTNGSEYSQFESQLNYQEISFEVDESVRLHGVLFKPDSVKPVGTIFHFSGKGMHLMSSVQRSYELLVAEGFQVFCYERRDFGMSNGTAKNSKTLKEDALLVYDQIKNLEEVKNKPTIVWGQSLGGAFASMLANERQNDFSGLVLEGTFSSFPDIGKVYAGALNLENFKWVVPLVMRNDFPAQNSIQELTIPTIIIHSSDDDQVPYELGQKLYTKSNHEHTNFWTIDSKHIMGIYDYPIQYLSIFKELLNSQTNN